MPPWDLELYLSRMVSQGRNKSRWASKIYEGLSAFQTPQGIWYYTVMLFGLKNIGATYHRMCDNQFS